MGGQGKVPVLVFPFRMTAVNIDRYTDHKWIGFWWNLKEGYDAFEATPRPPRVGVSAKRYVFK